MQKTTSDKIKFGLYNVENLFLLFDTQLPNHFQKLPEDQWQKLSNSVYETKPLKKCLDIAKIILEQDPDIMMLCEVGGLESLNNFNQYFLNQKYNAVLIEGNSDRNIDVGFLVKKGFPFHFELVTNKNRPLHYLYPHESQSIKTGYPVKAASQFFSRDCAELRLFTESSEKPFLITLLTHLKSRLDPEKIDPGGTERRTAELRTALDIMKELQNQFKNCSVILAGDFNGSARKDACDPEFTPIYQETDLQDVLELAGVNADKRSTFYQIKSSTKIDGRQIDYCFISKGLHSKLVTESAFVYRYKDEFGFALDLPKSIDEKLKLPSDHYPLFFTLENLP